MREQQNEGDDKLFVKFYMGTIPNESRSTEEGHPVFDSVPFIKIIVPGDRNTVIDTAVTDHYRNRFAKLWKQFQESEQGNEAPSGLPLREWPGITRAQAEELAYLNIYTVEQLASVADTHAQRIMNFHELKRKAEIYLESAKDVAYNQKLAADNEALQLQIDALKQQLDQQAALFARLEAKENADKQHDLGGGASRRK